MWIWVVLVAVTWYLYRHWNRGPGPFLNPIWGHYYYKYAYFSGIPEHTQFKQLLDKYSTVHLVGSPSLVITKQADKIQLPPVPDERFRGLVEGIFLQTTERPRHRLVLHNLLSLPEQMDKMRQIAFQESQYLASKIESLGLDAIELNLEKTLKFLFQDIMAILVGMPMESIDSFTADSWSSLQITTHKLSLLAKRRQESPKWLWFFTGYSKYDVNVGNLGALLRSGVISKLNQPNTLIHLLFQQYYEPNPVREHFQEKLLLTFDELIGNAQTLFLMGRKASHHVLKQCLLILTRETQFMKRLEREVHPVMLDSDAIDELVFLDHFIKEVLRLYPPIPFLTRKTVKPSEFGGRMYPKNTIIKYSVVDLNKQGWKDPDAFVPDRWSTEAGGFYSFGSGEAACLGRKWAMIQIKIGLATLVKRFKMEPCDEEHVILMPRQVLNVRQ